MTTERMPHVLVADDNKAHCAALGQVLERAGYEVAIAADGQEALLRLRTQPFDLVIADLRMPRLSGLGLLWKIRSKGPEVPVVILTALGDLVTYSDAMNSGAVAYLCKPVRRADLLRAARKAVGGGTRAHRFRARSPQTGPGRRAGVTRSGEQGLLRGMDTRPVVAEQPRCCQDTAREEEQGLSALPCSAPAKGSGERV